MPLMSLTHLSGSGQDNAKRHLRVFKLEPFEHKMWWHKSVIVLFCIVLSRTCAVAFAQLMCTLQLQVSVAVDLKSNKNVNICHLALCCRTKITANWLCQWTFI